MEKGHYTNQAHVVINGNDNSGRLECLHCGASYTPRMPCTISIYIAMLKAFGDNHDQCLLIMDSDSRAGPAAMPYEKEP